jgi:hypothetical protein
LKTKYYKGDLYLSTTDSIFHLLILSFIYIRSISWTKRVEVSFRCHPNLHREMKYSGSSCGQQIIMYTRCIPVKGISYIFISLRTLRSEEVESHRGQSIFWGHNTRLEVDIPSNEIEEFHGICLTKIYYSSWLIIHIEDDWAQSECSNSKDGEEQANIRRKSLMKI